MLPWQFFHAIDGYYLFYFNPLVFCVAIDWYIGQKRKCMYLNGSKLILFFFVVCHLKFEINYDAFHTHKSIVLAYYLKPRGTLGSE